MFKAILVRYGIPVLLAISAIAYFGVPYANQALMGWFREDVEHRAQMLANAMADPVRGLIQRKDTTALAAYLASAVGDEKGVGVILCEPAGSEIHRTQQAPAKVACLDDPTGSQAVSTMVNLESGWWEVSPFLFATNEARPFRIVVAQDMSFVLQRQSVVREYVLAVAGISIALLTLLIGVVARLTVRHWVKLLVGDIRGLRFLDDAKSSAAAAPILSQVRQVLREVESNQRLEIDFHENWTPQALQQVVREHLRAPEMLVVSNREPYIHNESPAGPVMQMPASGMVTALEPIMRACSGTWVAHGSGTADRAVVDKNDRVHVPPENRAYVLRRVWLSAQEEEGFYYGFSNEGLWPLCHLTYVRPAFREADWHEYERVNQKFADSVLRESRSSDPVILVQDYHLALLPGLLRQRRRKSTIALFWHIPWPNPETFGVCPWKREILSGMLGADILGFHTRYHCQNFLGTVDRFIECQIDHEHMTVTLQGHVCQVVPYPISVEWPPRWLAQLPEVPESRKEIRSRYGISPGVCLGVGVERWDFTKGIVERFLALEALLDRDRSRRGRVTLLQVAAPSRSKLPAYQALQQQTLEHAQRINTRFGTENWQPIVLVNSHQDPQQVFELYRAADFCLVNTLHDGMNLVAKEFVAARDDEDGVLILSTFAGASRELIEALLVNPYDVAETATAIGSAMDMPRAERRERMKLMRRTVKENNVYRWAGRMLMDLARIRQRQALLGRHAVSWWRKFAS